VRPLQPGSESVGQAAEWSRGTDPGGRACGQWLSERRRLAARRHASMNQWSYVHLRPDSILAAPAGI